MKRILLSIITLLLILSSQAQVQIKPLPKQGYEKRIRQYVDQMKVVDTHEHLYSPTIQKQNGCLPTNFMYFFFEYANMDISSAGMPWQQLKETMTAKEKWQALKPYWDAASNTTYDRAVLLAADKLFGIKNIDSTTIDALSEKIRKAYQNPAAWTNDVLKEKCNIEYLIEDVYWDWKDRAFGDPQMVRYVRKFDDFINIHSKSDIDNLSKWKNSGITTLDNLVASLEISFHSAMSDGIVGVKSALAYNRILFYDDVKKETAENGFNKIINSSGKTLSFEDVKPLQDYMMHRVLDLCKANNLPIQFHTGLQNGNGNNIENSKPTHLVNLFLQYPDVKFILFHGAYPYGGELSTLAKNFRNVYIDMCWMYIISPSYSERYLHEWLETVPANKIMAFGGDYCRVEGTYSHLLLAKQVISNVLIAKVRDGYFTEAEAMKIAQMILHDNAVRILNLK